MFVTLMMKLIINAMSLISNGRKNRRNGNERKNKRRNAKKTNQAEQSLLLYVSSLLRPLFLIYCFTGINVDGVELYSFQYVGMANVRRMGQLFTLVLRR